jgi:hypothetical protein
LYITNEFGREVRVVFCDISKAFDRVWHKGLLGKLESIGIRGSLLVSSVNNVIVELISVSMSFMKTMNKRDPKIDPWGTPAFMSRQLEVELLITKRCFKYANVTPVFKKRLSQ